MYLRILHISTRLILGGSQENTLLSCEGQALRGHRVHLAFGPIYGPEGSMLARVECFNQAVIAGMHGKGVQPITTHVVPHLLRELHPWKDYLALRELQELIKRLLPDIVHTHSSKAGVLGRLAADKVRKAGPEGGLVTMGELARMRVVHTIHGPPFMPLPTAGSGLAALVSRQKTRLANYIYTLAERKAAHHCDAIVSVANAMTAQFLARAIGRPEQYITIYSGMEVETFTSPPPEERPADTRGRWGVAATDTLIGTVARLARHKGHDDLLDAVAPLLNRRPDIKLLWVGDGWWRERLLARAAHLGIRTLLADDSQDPGVAPGSIPDASAQLILTGLVPPQQVPSLMRTLDLLVHPSMREGLPRTIPQALLSGVCPIAYDVDGTGEVCRDMQTGRLVPAGNSMLLRAAIEWAIENPIARQALAQRGRAACLHQFSLERMIHALEAVYQPTALRLAADS